MSTLNRVYLCRSTALLQLDACIVELPQSLLLRVVPVVFGAVGPHELLNGVDLGLHRLERAGCVEAEWGLSENMMNRFSSSCRESIA